MYFPDVIKILNCRSFVDLFVFRIRRYAGSIGVFGTCKMRGQCVYNVICVFIIWQAL